MSLDELTITLDDRAGHLSADALSHALVSALEMLRNVERDFVAANRTVRWEIVRITMRSPLRLTIAPRLSGRRSRTAERRIIKAAVQGAETIERSPKLPKHFGEDGLIALKNLVTGAARDGADVAIFNDRRQKLKLTEHTVQHVEQVVAGARYYIDYSTIEGQLEALSMHGGKTFAVWDSLTKAKVDCVVSDDQFNQWSSFLGKRVAISGRVKYRNDIAKTIYVEELKLLRGIAELPQIRDIPPINITDGEDSEDFIRRIRNA